MVDHRGNDPQRIDSRIALTDVAQPANFLLQVALTAALGDIGVQPGAIVGHSVGEVDSAYVSDVVPARCVAGQLPQSKAAGDDGGNGRNARGGSIRAGSA